MLILYNIKFEKLSLKLTSNNFKHQCRAGSPMNTKLKFSEVWNSKLILNSKFGVDYTSNQVFYDKFQTNQKHSTNQTLRTTDLNKLNSTECVTDLD